MVTLRRGLSCLILLEILLVGFTYAWEDSSRRDVSDDDIFRSYLIKRIADRLQNLPKEFYSESGEKRRWVPDVGYSSRGQAGEDVSRRLLAKALANNPYGPGRRK
ncbi:uncharacterized protein LOC135468757 [Liolophura sinensis]|uniref:uncharacterized protein LOC135468757 n=1 Tax=Liolophura sinensis TaxID=3198878 RepID=UPI00315928CC